MISTAKNLSVFDLTLSPPQSDGSASKKGEKKQKKNERTAHRFRKRKTNIPRASEDEMHIGISITTTIIDEIKIGDMRDEAAEKNVNLKLNDTS